MALPCLLFQGQAHGLGSHLLGQDQRLLVDEILLLGRQLPCIHAGKQGLWLWWHHHSCKCGRWAGQVNAKVTACCPWVPSGPLAGSSLLPSLPEKGPSAPAQAYVAWRGLRPLLASWAWVLASWLAGIQASASFLGTLREQCHPYLGPQTASLQPQAKKRVWAAGVQAGALTPDLRLPRPCLPKLLDLHSPMG